MLSGISCPFFRIALSNTIPSDDSACPLARAEASLTCPTSCVPFGSTVLPFDLQGSVVRAFTGSPDFAFFESTGAVNSALIAVPFASAALLCPACAFAEDAAAPPPDACAPCSPAVTFACPFACVFPCAPACVCPAALTPHKTPTRIAIPARYIVASPPGLPLPLVDHLQPGQESHPCRL